MWFHDHNLSYQQSHNRSCCVSEDMASGLPASVSWYTRNPLLLLLQSAHSTFFLPQQSLCNETVPVHRREGRCVTHDTSPQRLCSSLGLLKKKEEEMYARALRFLCYIDFPDVIFHPGIQPLIDTPTNSPTRKYRSPENVIISPVFTASC